MLSKGQHVRYYPKGHPELHKTAIVFEVTHNRVNLKEDKFKHNTWSISIHKSNLDSYVFEEATMTLKERLCILLVLTSRRRQNVELQTEKNFAR